MENHIQARYCMRRETQGKCTIFGETAPTGHPFTKIGQESVPRLPSRKRIGKLDFSQTSRIPGNGSERSKDSNDYRASVHALPDVKTQIETGASKGSSW